MFLHSLWQSKFNNFHLEPNRPHQTITNSDDNAVSQDRRRDTPGDEMPDLQVPLTSLGVFHHDGGHVGEARSRQAHGSRSHQDAAHDQEVRVRLGHTGADLLDQRKHDQCGDGV
jgi:hypothetical protein